MNVWYLKRLNRMKERIKGKSLLKHGFILYVSVIHTDIIIIIISLFNTNYWLLLLNEVDIESIKITTISTPKKIHLINFLFQTCSESWPIS